MAIEQDEIEKIAALARIRIEPAQIGQVTQRITEILHMVDQLQAVDTSDVEPMANPLDAIQVLRADEVTEVNRREAFQ
ncbi:MAG: Asp-tRNA(Asn)/Glu-tRNA(Gln) amidotransferase subunit GatC, partial [Halieaceae bacterium]|nr:Asp-tRNA(Asn)/Glu-tRNA(Gln) amidotransferase subunit GatC [Halieaceae bacterium]